MFETLNEFKLKSCQLQSFITFRDLQLSFWKFLHPKPFTKFEVHFAVCQIWGTRQSLMLCRVPWSGTRQTFFLHFFVFFFFCSFCFLLLLFFRIDYHALLIYHIKFTQLYVFNFSTHIIALFYAVIDKNSIYINSVIALDTLKMSNSSKKLPKFYMK